MGSRTPLKGWMLVLVALAAASSAGCARRAEDSGDAAPAGVRAEVRVTVVTRRTFRSTLDGPGQWKNATETPVQAPFDAVVDSLSLAPGDRVTRGQRLGYWRTFESDAALRGAQLLVAQARDSTARREAVRALALARGGLVRVPIESPVTGTLLRRDAVAGTRLAAGTELLALVADDDVVFEARLAGAAAATVARGTPALLLSPAPAPARVVTVLPSAGGDQSTLVWLKPDRSLLPEQLGRFARARLLLPGERRWLAVPDSAVVEDDLTGQQRIAIADSSDHVRWCIVTAGPLDAAWRAIEGAGVREGERVIVEGQRALADGALVRARP